MGTPASIYGGRTRGRKLPRWFVLLVDECVEYIERVRPKATDRWPIGYKRGPNPNYNDRVDERHGPLPFNAALAVHDMLTTDDVNLARSDPDRARAIMNEFSDFMEVPPQDGPYSVQRFMIAITHMDLEDYVDYFGIR